MTNKKNHDIIHGLLCNFFKYFRDNGDANVGMSIEQFVEEFLSKHKC